MSRPTFIMIILAALLFSPQVKLQASVSIENTRIIYSANAKETTIRLTNYSQKPVLVQSWIDDGDANASPVTASTPFILTPPICRIDGEHGQTLRIQILNPTALPTDRETVYWVNILDIPLKPPTIRNEDLMTVALRSRIKLFYRPNGLKGSPEQAVHQLRWHNTGENIIAINNSQWHISLTSIITPNGIIPANMIAPLSSHTFHQKIATGTPFQFTWINDYGALKKIMQCVSSKRKVNIAIQNIKEKL
ncbi:molecular chaperone [Citrobacter sp. BDA59-3]|uniref:fimbrial biogenesis chaperone n=1 Tax=Citrobacter sp. BDA59-3 TaxID=2781952 RepID=UPI00188265CF|nr:molecular chaperone [Citrobacter sp. BDA59-3]QOV69748.1 molecular chaperone [Citrobacter sp. BDA59-3]